MAYAKSLPIDVDGRRVQGGSEIPVIKNVSINTSSYSAVTLPADTFCKAVMLKTRAGKSFRIATSDSPTEYARIDNPISFNVVLEGGDTLCYVRADTEADTLEIIYLD
jgi:hypothetical protein